MGDGAALAAGYAYDAEEFGHFGTLRYGLE